MKSSYFMYICTILKYTYCIWYGFKICWHNGVRVASCEVHISGKLNSLCHNSENNKCKLGLKVSTNYVFVQQTWKYEHTWKWKRKKNPPNSGCRKSVRER